MNLLVDKKKHTHTTTKNMKTAEKSVFVYLRVCKLAVIKFNYEWRENSLALCIPSCTLLVTDKDEQLYIFLYLIFIFNKFK